MDAQVNASLAAGLADTGYRRLREILSARVDTFRLEFGLDPPVRVEPMQVRLKPDARPAKTQSRRYSPDDRAFLDRHTAALLEHGLVYVNHRSRWASAPRIVRKKEQETDPTADPRMTIDMRAVNERTEAMKALQLQPPEELALLIARRVALLCLRRLLTCGTFRALCWP
jgi:DNA-binding transcriptional ArsR family regulator